ncbi:MAG: metalloregulator ArsR/SmtB family transcription factor [Chloroflexi bacterium]|nr:metalloregulator ArsR/SmtB family transcription factor [Chloroflexota bacterium]
MSQRSIFEIQADLCKCMSSAVRIEIVHLLRDGPQRVSEITRITGHPQATISRHLGVLRNGGVVIAHRHAQDVIYQIANPKIVEICDLMREVLMAEASHSSKIMEGFQDEHSR